MNKPVNLDEALRSSEVNPLTVTDVCAIIRACRKNGVSHLEFENLTVKLGAATPSDTNPAHQGQPVLTEAEQKEQEARVQESLELAEREAKQRYIEELKIANPDEYEDLIAKGELVNAGEKSEGPDA